MRTLRSQADGAGKHRIRLWSRMRWTDGGLNALLSIDGVFSRPA
jgi:hypothetical protein